MPDHNRQSVCQENLQVHRLLQLKRQSLSNSTEEVYQQIVVAIVAHLLCLPFEYDISILCLSSCKLHLVNYSIIML